MKNTIKKVIKCFGAICVCTVMLMSISFRAFAESGIGINVTVNNETDAIEYSDCDDSGIFKIAARIIDEIEESRTQNTKTFKLDNGNYYTAVYDEDVHIDSGDTLLDIDNRLYSNEVNGITRFETNNGKFSFPSSVYDGAIRIANDDNTLEFYINNFNDNTESNSPSQPDSTVELSGKAGVANYREMLLESDVLISERKNALYNRITEIKQMPNTEDKKEAIEEINKEIAALNEDIKAQNEKYTELCNLSDKIVYKNVTLDTDFEYVISPSSLKESIILNNSMAKNEFSFTIIAPDSIVSKNSDNSITLFDIATNKPLWEINAPYMVDSNGADSTEIAVFVELIDDGEYVITYCASQDWLQNPNRVYPVIIDPSVQIVGDSNYVEDTYFGTSSSYNTNTVMTVNSVAACYIKLTTIDSALLKNENRIVSANMVLKVYTSDSVDATIHNITSSTNAADIRMWNFNYDSIIEEYIHVPTCVSANNYTVTVDITRLAQQWVKSTNHGLLIKYFSGDNARFYTSERTGESVKPTFNFEYKKAIGLEDYWTYSSAELGQGGIGYINDFSGHLVYVHDDAGIDGSLMPVSIKHIFNTTNINSYLTFGYGWSINLVQRIVPYSASSNSYANGYRFTYYDGDGTPHDFKETTEIAPNSSNTYISRDVDGLGLSGWMESNGSVNYYKMADGYSNTMIFNQIGPGYTLTEISNKENKTISITYDNAAIPKITQVTDGSGRTYVFNYDANTYLESIVSPDNKTISFGYTGGTFTKYLTSITYNDGTTTTFSYSGAVNKLEKITNFDNTFLQYGYNAGGGVFNLTKGIIQADNSVKKLLDINMISYQNHSTTYTYSLPSSIGNKTVTHVFDNYGRTIQTYNSDSTVTTYVYNENSGTSLANNKIVSCSESRSTVVNLLNTALSNWNKTSGVSGSYSNTYITPFSVAVSSQNMSVPSNAYQNVSALTKGKTYTLSAYVSITGATFSGDYAGAYLMLNGGNETIYSRRVTDTAGFEKISVSFTIPSNANYTTLKAQFGISGTSGTAYFSCIQLEENDGASEINLLSNSDFRYSNNTSIPNWITSSNVSVTTNQKRFGALSLKLSGSRLNSTYAKQTVSITGNAGDTFTFGGWVKAEKSITVPNDSVKAFSLYIELFSGTNLVSPKRVDFNADTSQWQYLSGTISATGYYSSVRYSVFYDNNLNSIYFDGAELLRSSSSKEIVYDEFGNVYSVTANGKIKSYNNYINGLNVSSFSPLSGYTSASYDLENISNNNRIVRQINGNNISTDYNYDNNGNILSQTVSSQNSVTTIIANTDYRIRNLFSGMYIKRDSNSSGADIRQYNYFNNNNDNITWRFSDAGNGYYYIIANNSTNRCFDVYNGSSSVNTNIRLYSKNNTNAQMFKLVAQPDGSYRILTKASNDNYCVGVYPEADSFAANNLSLKQMQIATVDFSSNIYASQCWIIEKAAPDLTASTAYTYSLNNNYVVSKTDTRGNTTTYSRSNVTGRINAITDALSHTTSYSYDANDLLIGTSSASAWASYDYNNDRLLSEIERSAATNGSVKYNFAYDARRNITNILVGSGNNQRTLVTNAYSNNVLSLLNSITYGNSHQINYTYDSMARLKTVSYGNVLATRYHYDNTGRTSSIEDLANDEIINLYYNGCNNLEQFYNTNGLIIKYDYNSNNLLSKYTYGLGGRVIENTIDYGEKNRDGELYGAVSQVLFNETNGVEYSYDALGRIVTRKYLTSSNGYQTVFSYLAGQNGTTTSLVSSMSSPGIGALSYTYDANGNILTVKLGNTLLNAFEYDSLGQLSQEIGYTSVGAQDYKYTYQYDNGGNIKRVYQFTTFSPTIASSYFEYSYSSDWNDLLTKIEKYDCGASGYYLVSTKNISTDTIGNTTSDGTWSYTWQNGRQLSGMSKYGSVISYTYDYNGIRTEKTVNGTTYKYYLDVNGNLVSQSWGNNYIDFHRDEAGRIYAFTYNGTVYYYVFNLQGDVIGIINNAGTVVVKYSYDAWGKILSTTGTMAATLGVINPIRYRGYYYDTETGLYYLQSRYYSPVIRRFINADTLLCGGEDILGLNLFTYCGNNPVMGFDPSGKIDWGTILDLAITAVSIYAGFVNGAIVYTKTVLMTSSVPLSVLRGAKTAVKTIGRINNSVNAIYYHYSSGESNLENDENVSSYVTMGYINRWQRLDYVKGVLGGEYSDNARRYYSEYNTHMYAWFALWWAYKKNLGKLSEYAERAYQAHVEPNMEDNDQKVRIITNIIEVFGF